MSRPATLLLACSLLFSSGCIFDVVEDPPFLEAGDLDVSGIDPGLALTEEEVASVSELVLAIEWYFENGDVAVRSDLTMATAKDGDWQVLETLVETDHAGAIPYDDQEPFPLEITATLRVDGSDAASTVPDLLTLTAYLEIPAPGVGEIELWRGWSVRVVPEWHLTSGGVMTDPTVVAYATAEPAR